MFDAYFDDQYPSVPPKINLETTGGKKVRFNPNLYSCGKVCLSLLGTWKGLETENWDPKNSTMMQVLISIQSLIMSDMVYFNEPSFEQDQGTEEGEKLNEGYSNIVRYCNIKYAMIEQMQNPPKGFESIVRLHFYLKKEEILKEVNKWVALAAKRQAAYQSIVYDHNPSWCKDFQEKNKQGYHAMLVQAVKELEQELNKLQPPDWSEFIKQGHVQPKKRRVAAGVPTADTRAGEALASQSLSKQVAEIDVSYDLNVQAKEMSVMDDRVKDRWSRYIGAMGIDAVAKQSQASVFLSGLGALGVEIAKNIVLSGVKRLTIHDAQPTTSRDLAGQFYLEECDIGLNRARQSLLKLQQLNFYVRVDHLASWEKPLPTDAAQIEGELRLKEYDLVVLTECDYTTVSAVDKYCRAHGVRFIAANAAGPYSWVFNDFGPAFTVLDKNGEDTPELFIDNISFENPGRVTLLKGLKHNLEDGDCVEISRVEGMSRLSASTDNALASASINGSKFHIRVINSYSFYIDADTRSYAPYVRNGIAKAVKEPKTLAFRSFEDSVLGSGKGWQPPFDASILHNDFLKAEQGVELHHCFKTLDLFVSKFHSYPKPWDLQDWREFYGLGGQQLLLLATTQVPDKLLTKEEEEQVQAAQARLKRVMMQFCFVAAGTFAPLCAFVGGYIAQDALKALTNKYVPTHQLAHFDCREVCPPIPSSESEVENYLKQQTPYKPMAGRGEGLNIVAGSSLVE